MRFNGYVEKIGAGIDVSAMREWVSAIPLSEWPNAPKPTIGDPYSAHPPAIVNMPGWHNFAYAAGAMIGQIKRLDFPALRGKRLYDFKISTLVPWQFLGTHLHGIGPDMHKWCFRVHVPIKTNPSAFFIADRPYHLEEGSAYMVNVQQPHAVVNHGDSNRVHFMFEADDV